MARVRRDEAKAAEEERLRLERAKIAENEDRVRRLKKRGTTAEGAVNAYEAASSSQTSVDAAVDQHGHVNLFAQLEAEERQNLTQGNAEYEAEKKKEQADWESKMGIMKRLAEDSNEYLKEQYWWQKIPLERPTVERPPAKPTALEKPKEKLPVSTKPIFPSDLKAAKKKRKKEMRKRKKEEKRQRKLEKEARRHRSPERKRKKRSRSSSSDSSSSSYSSDSSDEEEKKKKLERLREERLQRERAERVRAQQLLAPKVEIKQPTPSDRDRKYNSQFNPEFARR